MLLITAGVALWGLFHAVGAYSLNHNPWRAVVVLAAVALFLGFWWAMLTGARGERRR